MPDGSLNTLKARTVVIACRDLKPELDKIAEYPRNLEICYLNHGLHRSP